MLNFSLTHAKRALVKSRLTSAKACTATFNEECELACSKNQCPATGCERCPLNMIHNTLVNLTDDEIKNYAKIA